MFEALGHYKILDRIGAGGMGDVYRGRDTRLGRTVAIKVPGAALSEDAGRRERLLHDARATAVLSHPNIAALYEIGEDQGHLFLVFEFVPGHTLKTEIGGRPMNPRRAVDLAIQMADALADAHAAGIVHRDIEPGNIIVTPKGSAKILDFGLATWTAAGAERDRAARGVVTSAGAATGTVAYMSPEQALGEQVDQRTDIFSLGVVLFEMLTGKLPFEGTTPAAMALQIVQSPAASVTSVNPSLPREIEPVVAKALAKGLNERYGSAAALAADLRAVVAALDLRSGSNEAAAVGPTASARGGRRSAAGFFWLLGAVVAALALVLYSTPSRQLLTRTWKQTLGSPPAPVIAVIPLETDPSQIFFADGLTDDLITRLGQTPGLEVLGRSATREYRGRSPRDVARELNAAVVLTGSVRPSAETVTIRVSLIDPSDGTALWTGQYTRDAKDMFAVQAQVAEDVAQALRVKLEPTASSARAASRTVDPRAYEAYLRGREAAAGRRPAEAHTFYQQAIDLDDGLAEAYAGLAAALYSEPISAPVEASSRLAAVKRAADRAYELAPDSPQANLAIGLATDRLTDRLTYLKKSIAIDASFSEGFHQIGDQIADFDPDRAIAFYRRALVLDPRLIVSQGDILSTLNSAGRADDAARELEAAAPETRAALQVPFQVERALDERRYADAVALLARNDVYRRSSWLTLEYAGALQGAGRSQEAYDLATGLVSQHPEDCEAAVTLAALTMDRKQASAARQRAAPGLSWLTASDPDAFALRCAAHAAAAVGNAQAAATLLRRIGADERLFKEWSRSDLGTTGRHLLRAPRYPWTRIASLPPVMDAVRALDRTYTSAQQQSAAVLGDVTPSNDASRRR